MAFQEFLFNYNCAEFRVLLILEDSSEIFGRNEDLLFHANPHNTLENVHTKFSNIEKNERGVKRWSGRTHAFYHLHLFVNLSSLSLSLKRVPIMINK